jgi:hypothetical protein
VKRATPRFSTRTLELDPGYFVIRYAGADVTAETSVTVTIGPGEHGRAEMLGEVDGAVGHLTAPGSILVLKVKEPVRLIVTIMTSHKVMKANVRLDVQRLDEAPKVDGTAPAPAEVLAGPGDAEIAVAATAAARSLRQEPVPLPPPAPWYKWEGRPSQVMLSMSAAEEPGIWSPPRLAEDQDLTRLRGVWGLRWALVGPGRQDWQLQARFELTNGERGELVGSNVAVPPNARSEIKSATLFIRPIASEEWRQILYWSAA